MSFEGYIQKLCANGHECSFDVYMDADKCDVCNAAFVWENIVDQTNGDGAEFYVELEVDLPALFEKCETCGHEETVSEETYKLPPLGAGRRL